MKAKQYIYTMCKNSESGGVAYKIYSVSQGITNEECEEIKSVMEYRPPKQFEYMMPNELEDLEKGDSEDKCPYAFGYFALSTGRYCIALSTYLGRYIEIEKDARPGNYIIHALIIEKEELDIYPVELFGENYLKKNISLEELNVPVPVPPLPEIQITDTGSIVNDDSIAEFLEDRKVYFSYLIAAAMEAKERNISLFINDTRENLVMWMAALQKLLPLKLSDQISFVTYTYNHTKYNGVIRKKDLLCVGVRPDAMGFNYGVESNNNTQIVVDFLGNGSKTESITITPYAHAMAEKFIEDVDEIEEFKEFLLKTDITTFTAILNEAYKFYEFINSQFGENKEHVVSLLEFAAEHCNKELNEQVAVELLENSSIYEECSLEQLKAVLGYICKYAEYMTFRVYELIDKCFWKFLASNSYIQDMQWLEQALSTYPELNKGYLAHYAEPEHVQKIRETQLSGLKLSNKLALLKFIFTKYSFTDGLSDENPLSSCVYDILQAVKEWDDCALTVQALELAQLQEPLVKDVLLFLCSHSNESVLQKMVSPITQWMSRLDRQLQNHITELLATKPELEGLLKEMHVIQIQTSENTETEFWSIYNQNYRGRSNVQISKLVFVYLQKEKHMDTVNKILKQMPTEQYNNPSVMKCMIECLENTSFKELDKMSGSQEDTLSKLVTLAYYSPNLILMNKSWLVYTGKQLLESQREISMLLSDFRNNITVFDTREEKEYLAKYFQVYFNHMKCKNDMKLVIGALCNPEKPCNFFNYFIEACKKEHKHVLYFTDLCIIAIQGTLVDSITEYIKSVIRKELRNLGEQDAGEIKQLVVTECGDRGRQFFEDLNQSDKKGIFNKLNGLLKK